MNLHRISSTKSAIMEIAPNPNEKASNHVQAQYNEKKRKDNLSFSVSAKGKGTKNHSLFARE